MAKEVVQVNLKGLYFFAAVLAVIVAAVYLIPRLSSESPPSIDDDPYLGSKDAKVIIIEFSDFECPACKRAEPVVKQVLSYYGDRILFVYRDFPIYQAHPFAQRAAEAANCAFEQGKYWEMHDLLVENQDALDVSSMKRYAREIGLDGENFDSCLDSRKYQQEVEKDANDGVAAGVRGTPTFFINGKQFTGGRSFEEFRKIIDREI